MSFTAKGSVRRATWVAAVFATAAALDDVRSGVLAVGTAVVNAATLVIGGPPALALRRRQ